MGWDYGYESRAELLARLKKGAVASKTTGPGGSKLWVVYETTGDVYGHPVGTRFIVLYLLDTRNKGGMTGYKAISEDMGPVECDCPLELLELAPAAMSPVSAAWREKVRNFHAEQRVERKPGDAVLVHGLPYTLVQRDGRSWLIRDKAGDVFRTAATNVRTRKVASCDVEEV